MSEGLRVWLWNATVTAAWAILKRLGCDHLEVHKPEDDEDRIRFEEARAQ